MLAVDAQQRRAGEAEQQAGEDAGQQQRGAGRREPVEGEERRPPASGSAHDRRHAQHGADAAAASGSSAMSDTLFSAS